MIKKLFGLVDKPKEVHVDMKDELEDGLPEYVTPQGLIAENVAKILPEGYYISVKKDGAVVIHNQDGKNHYHPENNVTTVVKKENGEVLYEVTTKTNADIMVESYSQDERAALLKTPFSIFDPITERIVEKEVVIEKEVYIEKEVEKIVEKEYPLEGFQLELDAFLNKESKELTLPNEELDRNFLKMVIKGFAEDMSENFLNSISRVLPLYYKSRPIIAESEIQFKIGDANLNNCELFFVFYQYAGYGKSNIIDVEDVFSVIANSDGVVELPDEITQSETLTWDSRGLICVSRIERKLRANKIVTLKEEECETHYIF